MTILRSTVIAKAQAHIPKSDQDRMWSFADWDTYFHEAQDIVHEQLVDIELGHFVKRGQTLTYSGTLGGYSLPSDHYETLQVVDDQGEIAWLDAVDEDIRGTSGYVVEGDLLKLVNWTSTTWPTTLTMKYIRTPKEIPAWDGLTDVGKGGNSGDTAYEPDYPFNTERGARVLARVIAILASIKDERATQAQQAAMERTVASFVDRLSCRVSRR